MSRKNTGAGKSSSPPAERSPVRPLPGASSLEASRPEWIDVTVMPRESPDPRRRARPVAHTPPRSRQDVYEQGLQENARFRESFMRWLDENNLRGAVRAMSEAGSMPMLTVRCAPRVLEQLRRTPEFEAGVTMPVEFYPSTC